MNKENPYNPENDLLANLKAQIVELTYIHGVKPVARGFYLEPKTLRDWRKLYEYYGIKGLVTSRSRLDIDLLKVCLDKFR